MKKSAKPVFVSGLAENLKSAKSIVLVNYTGMDVKSQQELKKRLKAVGAKMLVVKNTLLKRAADEAKIPDQVTSGQILSGQTALVIGLEDPLAPIQVVGKFAKEFEVLQFKVGIMEGSFQDTASLDKLATLPGRDALLGQVLSALMAPSHSMVGTLKTNSQQLISVLKTKLGGE